MGLYFLGVVSPRVGQVPFPQGPSPWGLRTTSSWGHTDVRIGRRGAPQIKPSAEPSSSSPPLSGPAPTHRSPAPDSVRAPVPQPWSQAQIWGLRAYTAEAGRPHPLCTHPSLQCSPPAPFLQNCPLPVGPAQLREDRKAHPLLCGNEIVTDSSTSSSGWDNPVRPPTPQSHCGPG